MTTAGLRFVVRLTPRAGRDRIDGAVGGELRARVAAAPLEGAANESLLRLLAAELDVPARAVRLVAGTSSRRKLIEVDGVDAPALRSRWPGLAV